MEKVKPNQLTMFAAFLAPFVLVILGCWIWSLQTQIDLLQYRNDQFQELLKPQAACTPVQVACVCPDYDEGWEDAQFVEGCDPALGEIPIEDLRAMCSEMEAYWYAPSC